MIIDQKIIEDIISSCNIVDIISEYISCNKKGKNYISICPFHSDTKPSLSISPERQLFKCFSCGIGGNVLKFISEFENVNFLKSIKILANKTNYKLDIDIDIKNTKYDKLYKINEDANDWFQSVLFTKSHNKILDYLLNDRNISHKLINEFQIGYASKIHKLLPFLEAKGHNVENIYKTGLIKKNKDKTEFIDFFQNRIIFPIFNYENKISGFSGRTILEESHIKYLNTPSTDIFLKSNLMYHFNCSNFEIRKKNEAIVVEGYMDVIALKKIDIKNTVAIMGVNLSKIHIMQLKKVTNKIIIFFDGDNAGFNANISIAAILIKNDFNVKIINNNTLYDPDELLNKNENLLKKIINNPMDPIDYLISKTDIKNMDSINNFYIKKNIILNSFKNLLIKNIAIQKIDMFLKNKKETKINGAELNINNNSEKKNLHSEQIGIYNIDNDLPNNRIYLHLFEQLILSRDAFTFYRDNLKFISCENKFYNKILLMFCHIYCKNLNLDNLKFYDFNNLNMDSKIINYIQCFRNDILIQNINYSKEGIINIIHRFKEAKNINKKTSIINDLNDNVKIQIELKKLNKIISSQK